MIQEVLSRENLLSALKRVEVNKGSHGVDGMSVKALLAHILQKTGNRFGKRLKKEPTSLALSEGSKSRNLMEGESGY